ncbi:hypothetical protein [Moraxella oblonga]|uniref:hypothetical protein n=1 Tax=Moraxella oblonga TaxID=200413 RepID=UPI0008375E3B|nr:hypothetical protein [Moraxella oblonga]
MLLDLPPTTVELIISKAEQAGVTVDELLLSTFAKEDEDAYYDWFYQHHFDIEKLDKSIKSGSTPAPHFDSVEQLADWLGGAR